MLLHPSSLPPSDPLLFPGSLDHISSLALTLSPSSLLPREVEGLNWEWRGFFQAPENYEVGQALTLIEKGEGGEVIERSGKEREERYVVNIFGEDISLSIPRHHHSLLISASSLFHPIPFHLLPPSSFPLPFPSSPSPSPPLSHPYSSDHSSDSQKESSERESEREGGREGREGGGEEGKRKEEEGRGGRSRVPNSSLHFQCWSLSCLIPLNPALPFPLFDQHSLDLLNSHFPQEILEKLEEGLETFVPEEDIMYITEERQTTYFQTCSSINLAVQESKVEVFCGGSSLGTFVSVLAKSGDTQTLQKFLSEKQKGLRLLAEDKLMVASFPLFLAHLCLK